MTLPWLLLRRRWAAAGGMLAWAVVFGFLPVPMLGWRQTAHYLHVAVNGPLGWMHESGPSAPPSAPTAPSASPAAEPAAGGSDRVRAAGGANGANGGSDTAGGPARARAAHVLPVTDNVSLSITSGLARWSIRLGYGSILPALAVSGALACACVAIAYGMYARNGVPCWAWPGARGQAAEPFRSLVAIEWSGLVVVAMAFSPNTNPRHLVMLILVHAAAAAILLCGADACGSDGVEAGAGGAEAAKPSRRPLVLGTALLALGLFLPWKGVMSPNFFKWWYTSGVPVWCLLVMYGTLLWVGLRLARYRSLVPRRSDE